MINILQYKHSNFLDNDHSRIQGRHEVALYNGKVMLTQDATASGRCLGGKRSRNNMILPTFKSPNTTGLLNLRRGKMIYENSEHNSIKKSYRRLIS